MTVTTSPAPARTDARPAGTAPTPDPARHDAFVRRAGTGLMLGAASWGLVTLSVTPNADTYTGERLHDASGLAFQLGAIALVTAMARTQALGPSRGARIGLVVERVLLSLASLWTVLHFVDYRWADSTDWVVALDLFWPLSMLGMFVVGVKLFRAKAWRGSLRTAPLIAETWAVVTVPTFILSSAMGEAWIASVVGGVHLLLGYSRLGLLMRRSPELTRA